MSRILIVERGSLSSEKYTPSRSVFNRVFEPVSYLKDNALNPFEIDVLQTNQIDSENIKKYRTIVFCKHNTEDSIRVSRLALQQKIKIIYDIDDLIHRFTEDSAAYAHMKNVAHLKEHIESADIVVASSEALKNVIDADFKVQKLIVIRTGFNVDKYYKNIYEPTKSNVLFTNGDNIKVNLFRKQFISVFNHFLEKNSSMNFEIFGDSEEYVKDFSRYHFLGALPWDEHKKWLSNNQVEFAIIPLGSAEENEVHRLFSNCKTPIKYYEYGAMRIPGIYSNAAIYRDVVTDRETGMLIENTVDAWESALEEMHLNTALRKKIADNAFEDVSENHHIKIAAKKWLDIL